MSEYKTIGLIIQEFKDRGYPVLEVLFDEPFLNVPVLRVAIFFTETNIQMYDVDYFNVETRQFGYSSKGFTRSSTFEYDRSMFKPHQHREILAKLGCKLIRTSSELE